MVGPGGGVQQKCLWSGKYMMRFILREVYVGGSFKSKRDRVEIEVG